MREATCQRVSKESTVKVTLNLDGTGESKIDTGVGFLDHLLTLFAFHSKMDLDVIAEGDLYVDDHHTVEDIGIVLGQALKQALGDRVGIKRYGVCFMPMDETLSRVVLDISGRSSLVYDVNFTKEMLGSLSSEMVKEFFRAVSSFAGLTLHIAILYGENNHHIAEAIFKGFGRAISDAVKLTEDNVTPSSKGILD